MTTRSKGKEEGMAEAAKELRKQQEEAAAKLWKEIAEQHWRNKAAEERRDKEKEKGKAKVQEEPEFELQQSLPTQQDIDTTRLNSLLLASTLMQTMRTRAKE